MLLISELVRLIAQVVAFAVSQRKFGAFLVIILLAVVAAISATVTVVTPVAIYPFL